MKHRTMAELAQSGRVRLIAGLLAAAVIYLVMFPLMGLLDAGPDSQRPMYDDSRSMAKLQYLEYIKKGAFKPLTVGPGETVTVGGQPFTPTDGNSVQVRLDPGGFCVQAHDAAGQTSEWVCYATNGTPPK